MSTASFLALAAFIACTVLHGGRGVWAKTPAPLPPAPAPLPPAPASSSPIPVPVPPTLPPAPSSLPPAIPSTTTPSPSPSMSSGTDCTTALFNLTSCLTYVEAGSTVPTPDKECCPALAGLMDSNPICLCELLAGGAENFGIKIDDSKALKLPSICKVETPPPSTCTELGYHVPNVAMAPAPASTSGGPELPGSATASPPMTAGSSPVPRAAGLFSLAGLTFFAAAMVQILI